MPKDWVFYFYKNFCLNKYVVNKRNNKKTLKWYHWLGLMLTGTILIYAIYLRISPIRIGVLLKFSGAEGLPYKQVLEWAKNNSGRKIEFVYVDANTDDIKKAAQPLLNDHSIRIVIGPDSSDQVMTLAPLFIKKKKLLISPTASSADLYRAFAGQNYFWRTVESDVAQVRTILEILREKKINKIALIYPNNSYGKTFFDWTGFYATEMGIKVTSIQALNANPDYQNLISDALKDNPDYIICATSPKDTVELKKILDKTSKNTKLFLTDINETEYLLKNLGKEAEGLESVRPAADPNSGFDTAFRQKFNMIPPAYMATTYDAFMLTAAALARQEYIHKYTLIPLPFVENTVQSLKKIIYHQNDQQTYKWNEIDKMLEAISKGKTPNLSGASGEIIYDLTKGVDPTATYYSYSVVKNGAFIKQKTIPSMGGNISAADTRASNNLATLSNELRKINFKEKKDFRAVIMATSEGWENYRHQSDAAAVYNLLKNNGVSDDKISLFIEDDVPRAKENIPKNSLFHAVKGNNNYEGAKIDFKGDEINLKNFEKELINIDANENTNLLIYIVDHGGSFDKNEGGATGGDYQGNIGIIPFTNGDILSSVDLKKIIDEMKQKNKFRQMLLIVEACYGGAMGQEINTPGVLFLSGASKQEVSYGANYDGEINQWLADSFTYQMLEELKKNPDENILDFYKNVYMNVPGSHVTILNEENFAGLESKVGGFFGL